MPESKSADRLTLGRYFVAGIVFGGLVSVGVLLAGFKAHQAGTAGIALAAGVVLGALIVSRNDRSSGAFASSSTSSEMSAEIRDRLEASLACRDGALAQARRAEALARDRAGLLLELGRSMHPKFESLEKKLERMGDTRLSKIDRRGVFGRMRRDIGVLKVLLSDLLALGEVESKSSALQSVPFDLRDALAESCRERGGAMLELDRGFPALFLTDPALLRTAIDRLSALMDDGGEGRARRLSARADPTASDLMRIEVIFEGAGAAIAPSVIETLQRNDGMSVSLSDLRGGGADLSLTIAVRAVGRLGGAVRPRQNERGGVDLILDLVLPVTVDRRARSRDSIEKRNEALVSF